MKKAIIILCFLLAAVLATWYFTSGRPPGYTPMITTSATLNFGVTLPGAATDLTMTIAGAAVNDVIALGVPSGSMPSNGGFLIWISSANTATVRFINIDPLSTLDPPSGTFTATIIKN